MAEFGKLNFAVAFNPQTAFPLDARYYFDSLSAAQTAASAAQNTANSNKTLIDSLTYVQATVKDVTLVLTEKEGAN